MTVNEYGMEEVFRQIHAWAFNASKGSSVNPRSTTTRSAHALPSMNHQSVHDFGNGMEIYPRWCRARNEYKWQRVCWANYRVPFLAAYISPSNDCQDSCNAGMQNGSQPCAIPWRSTVDRYLHNRRHVTMTVGRPSFLPIATSVHRLFLYNLRLFYKRQCSLAHRVGRFVWDRLIQSDTLGRLAAPLTPQRMHGTPGSIDSSLLRWNICAALQSNRRLKALYAWCNYTSVVCICPLHA